MKQFAWLINPPFYPEPHIDIEVDEELCPSLKECYELLRCSQVELLHSGRLGILFVNENGRLVHPIVPNLLSTLLIQLHTGRNIDLVGPALLVTQFKHGSSQEGMKSQAGMISDIIQRGREICQTMVQLRQMSEPRHA